jgi:hypothetical protein
MALFSTYPRMRAPLVCAAVGNRLQKGLERRPIHVLRLLVNGRLAKRKEIAIKDILIGRHGVLEISSRDQSLT